MVRRGKRKSSKRPRTKGSKNTRECGVCLNKHPLSQMEKWFVDEHGNQRYRCIVCQKEDEVHR